ncbi:uncharacterized protein [Periplaneta americana]|uniref:uncharacterized protein n=1 Tax=Periplaneta americana TaxID=6978 RepID=UPI0037E712FD
MALLEWTWSFTDWALLLLSLGVLLYFLGMSTYWRFVKPGIPHIKPLPFIGNMWSAMRNSQSFAETTLQFYNEIKNHPYAAVFIFRSPMIMITDPELIKTVTVKDFEHFTDHRPVVFEVGDPVWKKGLFSLNGRTWREMRSTLTPAFTSSKMKTMFVLVSECSKQLVDFLEHCYEKPPENGSFVQKEGALLTLNLKDLYTRYTNDVIATAAFGLSVDSLKQPNNEFYKMGQEASNFEQAKLFIFLLIPKLLQALGFSLIPGNIANFFRNLVKDTIATREREGIVRPDMLQLLMQAQKGTLHDENSTDHHHKNDRKQLDDEDIVAQCVLFFLAGFDTTSTLLCFTTHLLAVHPEIQSRLQNEIDETLQAGGGKISYEALHGMKYLDMIVSETLRLYPPAAAVDRFCVRKYTIKADPPLDLEPDDDLFIPIIGLHRDPRYFPDPERFDPERFSDENKHKINPMTYLPFGVGPRSCIGNRFALMESKLAIAHLLSRFNLKVIPKTPIPIRLKQKGLNLTVHGGFWLGLEPRNSYNLTRYYYASKMALLEWTWSFTDWVLLLLSLGVLLYFLGMSSYWRFVKPGIPHMKPLPFIGNMWSAMRNSQSFGETTLELYNEVKDHPYGAVFVFLTPMVMITDPELIKTVTVKDFEHFTDHRPVVSEVGDPIWRKGLFNLNGRTWKDMRSTLTPAFTSSKMKTMFLLVSECSKQLINFLEECYEKPPENDSAVQKDGALLILELKDLYTRYTNDVIATTAFGLSVDSLKQPKNEFYKMGQEASNFKQAKLFLCLMFPKLLQTVGFRLIPGNIANFFRGLVKDTMATREREGIVRPDMLHLLMQAQKGTLHDENSTDHHHHKNDKKQLDDEDIVAQCALFFLAGFDTTATLLCFVSHLLAVHPEIQSRLQNEIDETLQECDGEISYEALQGMKYLDMVVSETLRLYPPLPAVDRECVRKYTIKADPPLDLEPGDGIFLPIIGLHRDPRYFPDPERFDPERFSDENKHKINPLTYFPFGVGPRSCIGNRFALMESKLALAHLLSRFNLKVIPKTPIPIRMKQRGLNMTVHGGFWLGLEKRDN